MSIKENIAKTLISESEASVKSIVSKKNYSTFFTAEDIEDIISDTILKACRSAESFDPSRWKISTWIGAIARNCVKDALDYKMKRRSISLPAHETDENGEEYTPSVIGTYRGDEFETDRSILSGEFYDVIDDLSCSLNEKDRAVFKMMTEGMKPSEMAKEIGCSAGNAAIRVCRIRKKLTVALADLVEEYDISVKKLVA